MTASAPSRRHASSLASVDAAATTRAPSTFAISTAAEPTPPAAPRTSTVSPGRTSAVMRSASYAVAYVTGNAAALRNSTDAGTRISIAVDDTTASANAPTNTVPHTRSPTAKSSTPGPSPRIVHEKSLPGVNG